MTDSLPFELLEDPALLSELRIWSEPVYRDLLALQQGRLSQEDFDRTYRYRKAILDLDITGFTVSAIETGELASFLRILDIQKICLPVFRDCGATLIRAFADDLVALFDDPGSAVEAAFQVHERVGVRNSRHASERFPTECCIGIGYGDVYAIGPNLAMGDEMNRASKLGEDTARGMETLVTEGVFRHLSHRSDIVFELQTDDDLVFPYYKARRA